MDPWDQIITRRAQSMLPRALQSVDGTLTQDVVPGAALPLTLRQRADALRKSISDMEATDPDMSGMQNYMRERSQQGENAMLNALAAQFAGERFEPVQAQFLRRAAAARDPMKVGTGLLTPDGQFIVDPIARADRRVSALEKQATGLESQATAQENLVERLAEQRRQFNESLRQRRDAAEQSAQLRRDLAGIAASGRDNSQAFQRATTLRNEYSKKADKISEGTRHAETVMTLLSDPKIQADPTKQVSLVFAFGKMLDPESVVRESEYALISDARGMFESLLQKPDQIMTGARLTPAQLQSMNQIAQRLYAGSSQRRDDLNNYYRSIAERNRIPVEDVLPSFAGRNAGAAGGGDLAAAAKAELERRQKGGGQ